MISFADAIAQKIEEAGIGTRGIDVFVSSLPSNIPQGILIRAPIAGVRTDPDIPGWRKGNYQVIVRDSDYEHGGLRAKELMNALATDHADIDRFHIVTLFPVSEPIEYPRGDSGLIEFSISFRVTYVDTEAVI